MTNLKSQVWGGRLSASPDELNISFCAGRDVKALPMADAVLLEYDIWVNMAHARMLQKVGVLTPDEFTEVQNALLELDDLRQKGEFLLDPSKEDVHINIEHFITHVKGVEAGKKIHTGRSRNDQVSTDMRLFMRDQLLALIYHLIGLAKQILETAEKEKHSLMPGFTHYQPAMITTAGHWLTSWSQGLVRDIQSLMVCYDQLNLSPLGAAASFGTSWPIDREFSAELLGFMGVEENSLDCISTRGENETRITSAIAILMNRLGTVSQDLILLSTPYYDMLQVDDRFVTGSSIMPQKRNPDFAEILRAKAAGCQGTLMGLLATQKGSMSGYNRDSQQTKYLIMDLFSEVEAAPKLLQAVIETLTFNREQMRKAAEGGFMNSADVADWLAREFQLSFRDCYEVLSTAVKYSEEAGKLTLDALTKSIAEKGLAVAISQEQVDFLNNPESLLADKCHTGAPSPESVEQMIQNQLEELKLFEEEWESEIQVLEQAKARAFSGE